MQRVQSLGKPYPFLKGCLLTFSLALAAKLVSGLPFFSIMGQLVMAILFGMLWRSVIGYPESYSTGIVFSNKKLLRLGIILLGMRLNLADIYHAGFKVFFIALINIAFTFLIVYLFSRLLGVEQRLGILTACGTAICGAAAVVAIAPQIKANEEQTAIGAAIVAILGTIFTLAYTFLYPVLELSARGYGVFTGGTLHEIAHVIAAAAVGGSEAVDLAVIVKLTRVALLVPVAVIIGYWFKKSDDSAIRERRSLKSLPIPWFILGFLLVSGINSLGIFSAEFASHVVTIAYLLIAMAMAGLGLNVNFLAFKKIGLKAFWAGLCGSILLSLLGYILVLLFNLN